MKQFDHCIASLDQYLNDAVRPGLAIIPTGEHKKYFALLCAARLGGAAELADLLPDAKLRLQHEIAERIADLI